MEYLKNANIALKDVASVGEKTVRAVVTAPTLDRDGDVVDTESLRLPLKSGGFVYARDLTGNEELDIPFLTDHSFVVEDVIGSVRTAVINTAGELEVVFGVSSREKAQDMFTLLDEGHLGNAFSITFSYDYKNIVDGAIYDAEIMEISLVFRGSNRDARLLAVTKSLLKENRMSKDTTVAETKEQLEKAKEAYEAALAEDEKAKAADSKDVDQEETEQVESKEDEQVEAAAVEEAKTEDAESVEEEAKEESHEEEAEVETEAVEEKTVEAEATEEVEEPQQEETKQVKKEDQMEDKSKSVATKAAATAVNQDVKSTTVETKANPNDHKILTAKQIGAMVRKDYSALKELNEQAKKLDEMSGVSSKRIKSKELTYTGNTDLYLAEQLDRDVEAAYGDFGNVGTLVTRINLTESPKYSRIVRDGGVEFTKPGFAGTKDTDEPTWSRFELEPKPFAVIVAWSDHVAEDAYINAYNEIVRDIAEAEAELEDKIILVEAGETTGDGTVYPAQGLEALLGAGREVEYTADSTFIAALAEAYGEIQSADRGNLSLVMSGATWGTIALLQDKEGRPLWSGNGQTVNMGALGSVNVRTSDVITDDTIYMGNYRRYRLAAKEGLQLKTSSEAQVGDLNLFTEDASAVRAVKRLEGGVTYTDAFVKLVTTS